MVHCRAGRRRSPDKSLPQVLFIPRVNHYLGNSSPPMSINPLFLALGILMLVACSKSNSNTVNPPVTPPVTPRAPGPDIYVAGFLGAQSSTTAAYWKNDTMITLPGSS